MKPQKSSAPQSASRWREYRWALTFAGLVMVAISLPYVLGYFAQGSDWRFTGFVVAVDDGNAFIGKMLRSAAGEWLFRTPYTAFPQRGFLIFLPYILLGKLVSPANAHEWLVLLYHLFRFCAGVLAILATYEFLSFFIESVRFRRIGLVLATLGGGLGWVLVLLDAKDWLGSLPLEYYSPETFGFLSLYVYPHYALARALLLWGLVAYLKAATSAGSSRSIAGQGLKVGGISLLAALAQPITGMVFVAIVGIFLLTMAGWQVWLQVQQKQARWGELRNMSKLALWAVVVPAPFLLYNLASSTLDPFLKMWTEQSYFGSPNPLHYLLAYGVILPFAIIGATHLWRADSLGMKLPCVWVMWLPVLAYAPVSVQRRLPEGIWVAFVVLGMKALESVKGPSIRRAAVAFTVMLPSTALLLAGGISVALHPAEPAFRPTAEVAAFECLAAQSDRNGVVLSSYETGNALPAWVPVFVVIGHGPETIHFSETERRVLAFYQAGVPASQQVALLQEFGVDYVVWGPNERKLGAWAPGAEDFLSVYCQAGEYAILAVDSQLEASHAHGQAIGLTGSAP